MSSCKNTDWEI